MLNQQKIQLVRFFLDQLKIAEDHPSIFQNEGFDHLFLLGVESQHSDSKMIELLKKVRLVIREEMTLEVTLVNIVFTVDWDIKDLSTHVLICGYIVGDQGIGVVLEIEIHKTVDSLNFFL